MSDHGFKQFTREINLNTWLYQNGYLKLKKGADGGKEWLGDVDWSRTKAYAMGLAGIYLNIKGRESQGIVNPGEETEALKKELIRALTGLPDPQKKQPAINRIYSTTEVLNGPYLDNAPDLIVGYNPGYRAAWDSVTGKIGKIVLTDNEKAWGADHCIDPEFVPGVLFTSRKINNEKPAIIDIAPTVLELFGIPVPKYMEGKSLIK
jgi:predicted AlkP superfamily phosphohydrolase/phosphomutase